MSFASAPAGIERSLPFDNCRQPGVESIFYWRIVSIGSCPKVSLEGVAARRTSLKLWSTTQAETLRVSAKISLSLIFE